MIDTALPPRVAGSSTAGSHVLVMTSSTVPVTGASSAVPQPVLAKMSVAWYEEWACGVNELFAAGSTGKARATSAGSMVVVVVDGRGRGRRRGRGRVGAIGAAVPTSTGDSSGAGWISVGPSPSPSPDTETATAARRRRSPGRSAASGACPARRRSVGATSLRMTPSADGSRRYWTNGCADGDRRQRSVTVVAAVVLATRRSRACADSREANPDDTIPRIIADLDVDDRHSAADQCPAAANGCAVDHVRARRRCRRRPRLRRRGRRPRPAAGGRPRRHRRHRPPVRPRRSS